jgi:hypothetical protein
MLDRRLLLLMAVASAACTAVLIYVLAHDALGVPRHAIVLDSFGSAAFLAIVCGIAAALPKRRK